MTAPSELTEYEPGHVTILVPAKDEEEVIGSTLDALPVTTLEAMGFHTDVVVLDGDSQDATAEIARSKGATVLRDPGQGKGQAFREARPRLDGDYLVMLDADGTYAPDAIPRALDPLARGEADIVMGRRTLQPGSMKPTHRAGNKMLSLQASALYLRRCPDLCTGLWAFTAPALHALPLEAEGFELEADLFAMSTRMGLRIATVEVDYLARRGEAKLSGRRDGFKIAWWLVRSRFVPLAESENGHAEADRAAAASTQEVAS